MNLEAERKLKFDCRMQGRPGWATEEELQAELASLPDCSAKIADETEDEQPAPSAGGEAQPEAP